MKFRFAFIFIVLVSCIKEAKIIIPDHEPKIVVNSLFSPDTLLQVYVGLTSSMQDVPPPISNAVITVYKNGNTIGAFEYLGEGWYRSFHYPEEGADYKIEVSVPGFDMVWAESEVPLFPELIENPYAMRVGELYVAQTLRLVYDTYINFNDDPNKRNYYEIWGYNHFGANYDPELFDDPSIKMDSDLDMIYTIKSLVFTDKLFNGEEKLVKASFYGSVSPNTVWFSPLKITFQSISEDYFNYRKSLHRHLHLQNTATHVNYPVTLLFLGEPYELYSNVVGGYGVFAGFNGRLLDVERLD